MRRLGQRLWQVLQESRLLARPWGWMGWPLLWLSAVAIGTALGGLLGATVFVAFGTVGGHRLGVADLALNGLKDGAFYALIWCPGGAFVGAAVLAHRRAHRERA